MLTPNLRPGFSLKFLIRRHATMAARVNGSTEASHAKDHGKERIVILGSGWAGYGVARTLSPRKYERILISPRSHFVFTPLLASTSVGTLEFRAAIEPVRRLGLTEFHQAWTADIDFRRKVVRAEANTVGDVGARTGDVVGGSAGQTKGAELEVAYDKLVIAVGCYSQTFGIEGAREHACFLRDIGDARNIRLRVLESFERADLPSSSDEERRRLLHFVVVGGGPAGIEFAAELHDLVHEDLARLYPRLRPFVRITIYDIAPKVLPMFDQKLASYAADVFRRQGIDVKTQHHLRSIRREGDALVLNVAEEPREVAAGVVVWSTGLMQNPLVGSLLDKQTQGLGRLAKDVKTGGFVTDSCMRLQLDGGTTTTTTTTTTLPDVYAIGDCAVVQGQEPRYPATAQVANQQAVYLGKQLNKADGQREMQPFRFRDWGVMAYLGSQRAIHQSKADELRGWPAWVLWRMAYLTKSVSVKNKLMILVHWTMTWFFGRDVSRF